MYHTILCMHKYNITTCMVHQNSYRHQGKNRTPSANDMRPIQRSQSHDFVRYTLKTTDIPLDVRYKGLVGGKIPLCPNIVKGEPHDNEGLMRKFFFASIRCALKTSNEPLDVNYNVLVGCYIPLCNNDLKGEPLGVMRKSFFASIKCALKTTNEPLDVIYNVLVGCYIPLCNNDLKGEPLDTEGGEGVMRKSFRTSIRCALQTTSEPSHVAYNVLVGCYYPLRYNTLWGCPWIMKA